MELWSKARSFAEEAAKRSQELSLGASKLSDIIAETTKEIASQASKHLDLVEPSSKSDVDLERFGFTDELREFVKGITITTFEHFPLQDDTELSDVPSVSNVRQDLTEWQEKHANLVLSTVKISRLRYELCPRVMKERKFWRIYFIIMNSHIAPYENQYMEDAILKSSEQVEDDKVMMEPLKVELTSIQQVQEVKKETKSSNSSTEQDLDVFLLRDKNSDDDLDDGNEEYGDDDLDQLVDSSDDEKGKS
ncbi:uncharacterized protein LOC113847897 isoform X2 [Abrus precatorius]|uniref:Uncharacterized protein LOC113847897 isoform X2 n=1 Tax=Abrus precatorius TaxID=3816 RepID=A0A8B8JNJ3_ABRPR|nr:uncharacterized protein LOC113847897 isoform X2 [Abrus precatorius]